MEGERARQQIIKLAGKLREAGASPQAVLRYLMNNGLSYNQAMEVLGEIE